MQDSTKALVKKVEDGLFVVSEIGLRNINAVTTAQLMKQGEGTDALKEIKAILEKNNL